MAYGRRAEVAHAHKVEETEHVHRAAVTGRVRMVAVMEHVHMVEAGDDRMAVAGPHVGPDRHLAEGHGRAVGDGHSRVDRRAEAGDAGAAIGEDAGIPMVAEHLEVVLPEGDDSTWRITWDLRP